MNQPHAWTVDEVADHYVDTYFEPNWRTHKAHSPKCMCQNVALVVRTAKQVAEYTQDCYLDSGGVLVLMDYLMWEELS